MKKNILVLILICLAVSSLLFACTPEETEPTAAVPSISNDELILPPGNSDLLDLGLTEEEIKLLEERGVANVDSVEVASKIAGFTVAVPAYVPDGFIPGKFMIQISGAGLPAEMAPKFNNTKVQQVYTWQEDKNIMILLVQSPQPFSVGGSEPSDLCGQPAERKYTPADPAKSQPYDKLTLGWEKDGFYYALTGTLGATLDEEEMGKIACSISVE